MTGDHRGPMTFPAPCSSSPRGSSRYVTSETRDGSRPAVPCARFFRCSQVSEPSSPRANRDGIPARGGARGNKGWLFASDSVFLRGSARSARMAVSFFLPPFSLPPRRSARPSLLRYALRFFSYAWFISWHTDALFNALFSRRLPSPTLISLLVVSRSRLRGSAPPREMTKNVPMHSDARGTRAAEFSASDGTSDGSDSVSTLEHVAKKRLARFVPREA